MLETQDPGGKAAKLDQERDGLCQGGKISIGLRMLVASRE
jgi:hypothetical protein